MKTTHTKTLLTALAATASVGLSSAGTLSSAGFDVDPASTSINTADAVDWGYFLPDADFLAGNQAANTDFDALKADYNAGDDSFAIDPATNSKASSGIGAVTITENDGAEYSNGTDLELWDFTVSDGLAPVSGTQTAFGAVNGVASSENIFTITFNDVGVGTKTITLYMAHTSTNREFEAIVDLTAADGNDTDTLRSPDIGGIGGSLVFAYSIDVTTTDASADVSIRIDSKTGSSGQFGFAGYTVTGDVIPEPGSLALLGLGGLLVASRRRRA